MLLFKTNCSQSLQNSYGIEIFRKGVLIRRIPDLSENSEDVQKLVNLCNELQIEECHIDDIIDDYLTDFCI